MVRLFEPYYKKVFGHICFLKMKIWCVTSVWGMRVCCDSLACNSLLLQTQSSMFDHFPADSTVPLLNFTLVSLTFQMSKNRLKIAGEFGYFLLSKIQGWWVSGFFLPTILLDHVSQFYYKLALLVFLTWLKSVFIFPSYKYKT